VLLLGAALVVLSALRGGSLLGPAAGEAKRPSSGRAERSWVPPARKEPAPEPAANSPFHSAAACEGYLRARPRKQKRGPRIGSWNIRWFPNGSKDGRDPNRRTDLAWLGCAIASLDVDVLAVQEIVQDPAGRNALLDLLAELDTRTAGHWQAELDECPGSGRQHVGLLFDADRVEASAAGALAALNPGNSACDRNLRPGYGSYVRFRGGPDLEIVTVHLDSGTTARDFGNRVRSLSRLGAVAAEVERREHDSDLLVVGDFNSMGCKDCDPQIDATAEIAQIDALLDSLSLRRIPLPEASPCTHYQRGHAGILDHVVARASMEELATAASLEVYGPCADLHCKQPARGERPAALERLSDHCPIVLELQAGDRDRDGRYGQLLRRRGLVW
jgi:endonuclease/exonuclease/phosphatase family metal-dependent hydrolase